MALLWIGLGFVIGILSVIVFICCCAYEKLKGEGWFDDK